MEITAYCSIGNSDGRLTQARWAEFYRTTDAVIRSTGAVIYGAFVSEPTSPFQNACWSLQIDPASRAILHITLSRIAADFEQDTIVWVEGPSYFIKAATEAEAEARPDPEPDETSPVTVPAPTPDTGTTHPDPVIA